MGTWTLSTDEERRWRTEWMNVSTRIGRLYFSFSFFLLFLSPTRFSLSLAAYSFSSSVPLPCSPLLFGSFFSHKQPTKRTNVSFSFFSFFYLLCAEWMTYGEIEKNEMHSFFVSVAHTFKQREKWNFFLVYLYAFKFWRVMKTISFHSILAFS